MKFTLEEWSEEYIPSVAKYADNEKIAGRLRDSFPYPYTRKDAEWFVKDCMEKEGKTQFSRAIVIDGEAVGCIMTEAVQKMVEEAFRRYKLVRISSEPFSTNLASRGVLEKAGFTLEGIKRKSIFKNGCIQDSYLYAVIHV